MRQFYYAAIVLITSAASGLAVEQSWAGEYSDKSFLNGNAAFQLSIEQSGNAIQVSFDAVYNDGHGAAPEGVGPAKISVNGALDFKWHDSFNNAGTGRIIRAGNDLIVSINPTRVVDPRCLAFYKQNIRLKRTGKK